MMMIMFLLIKIITLRWRRGRSVPSAAEGRSVPSAAEGRALALSC
jgi:hypothetical protein